MGVCLCIHARNSFQSNNLFPYNSICAPEYGFQCKSYGSLNTCQEAGIVAYFMQNMCSRWMMDSMEWRDFRHSVLRAYPHINIIFRCFEIIRLCSLSLGKTHNIFSSASQSKHALLDICVRWVFSDDVVDWKVLAGCACACGWHVKSI